MHRNQLLKIATRQSPLALWQSESVKTQLLAHFPSLDIQLVGQLTEGDRNQKVALNAIGGKNLFVKELQANLLEHRADLAVHSIKDLSCTPHPKLTLAAICERADPRDVFIAKHYTNLSELPSGAVVGTSSPRRECQLKALRPDLRYTLLRGNVETRLQKLASGEYDAIILAAAGLMRLNLLQHVRAYFTVTEVLPAIGQGAIGVECRHDDTELLEKLRKINHTPSEICVRAERAVNARLGGDCFTPIAAYATLQDNQLHLHALVGSLTEHRIIRAEAVGPADQAVALGTKVAEKLLDDGAKELLGEA